MQKYASMSKPRGKKQSSKRSQWSGRLGNAKRVTLALEDRSLTALPTYRSQPADRVEIKILPTSNLSNTVSNSGQVILLNGCANGLGSQSGRVGDEINMTSISLRVQWATLGQSLSADETNSCRSILVYDKAPSGALPSISTILAVGNNPIAAPNPEYRGRFMILDDWLTGVGLNGPMIVSREKLIPCDLQTTYTANSSGITAIATGALYLLNISDSGLAPAPNCSYYVQVGFNDL